MKIKILIFAMLFLVITPSTMAENILYVVKQGDNLSKITRTKMDKIDDVKAKPLARLLKVNPQNTNPDLILTGEVLVIPHLRSNSIKSDRGISSYTVKAGDTLWSIARQYLGSPLYSGKESFKRLMDLNPEIQMSRAIFPGMLIHLSASRTISSVEKSNVPVLNDNFQEIEEQSSSPVEISKVPVLVDNSQQIEEQSGSIKNDQGYSELMVLPQFKFISLESSDKLNGGDAHIVSKKSYELPVLWKQNWSKEFMTYGRFSLSKSSFDQPNEKRLSDTEIGQYGFGLGAGFFQNKKNRLGVEFSFDEEIFLTGVDSSTVGIEKVVTPNLKINSEHDLYAKGPYTLGLGLTGQYLLAAESPNIKTKSGFEYGGQVYLRQKMKSFILQMNSAYSVNNQETTYAKQEKKEVVFGLTISVSFGD